MINLPKECSSVIRNLYNQHHRYYHNENHLMLMYNTFLKYSKSISQVDVFKIFYHDVVYDVSSKYNEENSIKLFDEHYNKYKFNISIEEYDDIITFIRLTKHHLLNLKDITHNNKLLLDCDLISLHDDFDKSNNNIIKEYCTVHDLKEVITARKIFFEELLNKEKIFYILEDKELQTRLNIQNWLMVNKTIH